MTNQQILGQLLPALEKAIEYFRQTVRKMPYWIEVVRLDSFFVMTDKPYFIRLINFPFKDYCILRAHLPLSTHQSRHYHKAELEAKISKATLDVIGEYFFIKRHRRMESKNFYAIVKDGKLVNTQGE